VEEFLDPQVVLFGLFLQQSFVLIYPFLPVASTTKTTFEEASNCGEDLVEGDVDHWMQFGDGDHCFFNLNKHIKKIQVLPLLE